MVDSVYHCGEQWYIVGGDWWLGVAKWCDDHSEFFFFVAKLFKKYKGLFDEINKKTEENFFASLSFSIYQQHKQLYSLALFQSS